MDDSGRECIKWKRIRLLSRPGDEVADSAKESATVDAFNLGMYRGRLVYRDVSWYFPQFGQSQSSPSSVSTCQAKSREQIKV
jgi:hypothetical protein